MRTGEEGAGPPAAPVAPRGSPGWRGQQQRGQKLEVKAAMVAAAAAVLLGAAGGAAGGGPGAAAGEAGRGPQMVVSVR